MKSADSLLMVCRSCLAVVSMLPLTVTTTGMVLRTVRVLLLAV